ncbi:MAG TPA: hypothetical protein VF221_01620 [Chloroflexota bacterium]
MTQPDHAHNYLIAYQDPDGDRMALTECADTPGVLYLATQGHQNREARAAVAISDAKVARAIGQELINWAIRLEAVTN